MQSSKLQLKIQNLRASVDNREILKGINLTIGRGQLHILMGPNGSGKSTLAQVIMGNPSYKVESGELKMENHDLKNLPPDKRAKLGIFLGFQHPVEVPGVSVFNMLRKAKQTRNLSQFREQLLEYASSLKLHHDFLRRSVNNGFSGGEKKRNEILQMITLAPKLAILDEIDSGLDVDGLKLIAKAIKQFTVHSSQSSVILITHYARILKYLSPDFVHVMVDGIIVKSGKAKLAREIEETGYQIWQTE